MGSTPDHSREPCPDRVLDDIGGAFSMGAVGGSALHFIKGLKNSPRGERLIGGSQAVRINAPRIGGSFAVWGGLFSTFDCSMVYIRQKEDPWNSIIAGAATGGFLQMRGGLRTATRSAIFGGVLLALIEGAGIMLNRMLSPPLQPPMEEPFPQMAGVPGQPHIGAGAGGRVPDSANMSSPVSSVSSPEGEKSNSWLGGLFGAKESSDSSPAVMNPIPTMSDSEIGIKDTSGSSWLDGFFGGKKHDSRGMESEKLESFDAPPAPDFAMK
ncbi:hypothetical protein O6H91_07G123000 [Diphasiastrum complanatum]|uniref:Uncharacterized protein n=3 Tax=Diphasiastrum complanatum TaxID=34168 RepID=A0ACC2D9P3_DIPCM|nr:hypothetical protein O6H91_07G123000 [Diphasiastrum complanatum]KAJ7550882.1 hypothetical protein O6H91_07G123000 [Diphasiastrum complanatum]KAJ7550883.1 hypothetical protein O6H91_07G123000 [Diphasiastrum complanatum]